MSMRNDILMKEREAGTDIAKLSSFELALIQEPTDHVTFDGIMVDDEEDMYEMQVLGLFHD